MADVELPAGLADILGQATMGPDQLADQLYDNPPILGEEAVQAVFRLNQMERDSQLWRKIDEMLRHLLHIYRESNDLSHGPIETAEIRGRIKLIKEFRQFGEPPAVDDDPDAPDLGY